MSYCRFSSGDVYMYFDVSGKIRCQACRLAPLEPSIFTTGTDDDYPIFSNIDPCEECGGEGCEKCMMHGDNWFENQKQAVKHLFEHRRQGHTVPQHAIDRLIKEINVKN